LRLQSCRFEFRDDVSTSFLDRIAAGRPRTESDKGLEILARSLFVEWGIPVGDGAASLNTKDGSSNQKCGKTERGKVFHPAWNSAIVWRGAMLISGMDGKGFEPSASALRTPRSPN
jgi:hypothetical protein